MQERSEFGGMNEDDLFKNIPAQKPPESESLEMAPRAPRPEIKKPAKKLAPTASRAESPEEERRRQIREAMKPFMEDVSKMMGRGGVPVKKASTVPEERRQQVHEAAKPFWNDLKEKFGGEQAAKPASMEKEKKPGFWKRLFGGGKKSS